jgi:integrase
MNRRRKPPKYRLHKSSGQAVVTLSGKDFYLGRHRSEISRREYDRLVGEWLANGRRLVLEEDSFEISVGDLILRYWEFCQDYYVKNGKPTSEQGHVKQALRIVRHLYGHTMVRDFGPRALKNCREDYLAAGQSRQKINQNVCRVRRMFKWGVENEIVPPNILHALQAVADLKMGRSEAPENKPVRPVPDEHVDAVLALVLETTGAMIRVQLLTGMRPGELVKMQGSEIDRSREQWIYRPASHKTQHLGYEREIALGPQARSILRPYLLEAGGGYIFSPRRSEAKRHAGRNSARKTPMTPSQRKRKTKARPKRTPREFYDCGTYGRAIKRACETAGIPSWHPHQLRHNAGTNIRKMYGIEAARVVLGHRSALVTEIYAEIDRAKSAEVMEAVG